MTSRRAIPLVCPLALLGCGALGSAKEETAPAKQAVSWEDFKNSVTRNVDGREIYVVEWDLAVNEAELRQRYEAYVTRVQEAGEGLGETRQPSIVNLVGGADDIWHNDQQLNLTYCVSNAFGAIKSRAVSEMVQATAAWQRVARVNFNYLSSEDANCSKDNSNVVFPVVPWASGGACSFFPSRGYCDARTLQINFSDLDTNYGAEAPNMRTVGVFRHELGHILGLRHEHTRPESGAELEACFENNSWRSLSPYDRGSVMHYPVCNGVLTSDLSITSFDALGASLLYGGRIGNLAAGKTATQSSNPWGADAGRAIDGNTDGNWSNSSVTHTDFDPQAWWQVDLGAVTDIGELVLYNRTDCCSDRLADFDVLLSNDGINWLAAASFEGPAPARTALSIGASGQFVRVRLRGTNYLSLAEVQVFAPQNLATGKTATESSNPWGADAGRAVDGNTDGNWSNSSVTHTDFDPQAWWQVDLGAVTDIGEVVLYNRTDCCSDRLADFDVLLSNDGINWLAAASFEGPAPARTALSIGASGQFVRVRLRGTNYLSLAEVQVFAP